MNYAKLLLMVTLVTVLVPVKPDPSQTNDGKTLAASLLARQPNSAKNQSLFEQQCYKKDQFVVKKYNATMKCIWYTNTGSDAFLPYYVAKKTCADKDAILVITRTKDDMELIASVRRVFWVGMDDYPNGVYKWTDTNATVVNLLSYFTDYPNGWQRYSVFNKLRCVLFISETRSHYVSNCNYKMAYICESR
ncbi:hypothetical protein Bpfe_030449 [Biomphalaria pfeifferi]|uniref:C-type lectin domain-containing protein n=1 Tax=Biomphalaria pfeifferi TaxID=112525 RepID=A0AAD8APR5_BIOPF|nr:hypothetical protein Bpfe_030449 [Biomphalaria pfeifferi]